MTLRGTCVGMQKTYILPGRKVYEYPYTPELFPWFYDKELWREYLDFLVANRMNTLYLWNGHPFASLVKLKDYPEAIEVSPEVFAQNVEMFNWLTTNATNAASGSCRCSTTFSCPNRSPRNTASPPNSLHPLRSRQITRASPSPNS
jgi:hypothetical protein